MMSTTRRINQSELDKIKEIQQMLLQEGIRLSQVEISEALVDFTILNIEGFLTQIREKVKDESEERVELMRLLFESHEGEIETDSVKEHDVMQ